MNHFFEYVCRSVIRSEDAINRLGTNVTKLAKCCRVTNARVACIGLGALGILAVVAMQDKEIKALQKQVADLAAKTETPDTTEEQTEQEGA